MKPEEVFTSSSSFIQQDVYLLDDLNTDILARKNTLTNSLEYFLRTHAMEQLITEPTRITNTSETAIDLMYSSYPERVTQSAVLPYKISYHNVIFCTRNLPKYQHTINITM